MSLLGDYRRVYRDEPVYFKMIIANAINRFGDALDMMALGFLVYRVTSSATWVAVILGANLVPTIVLQPFAGQLIGMAMAGLVISLLGAAGAMAIDALTFFASGIILCFVSIPKLKPENIKAAFFGRCNANTYFNFEDYLSIFANNCIFNYRFHICVYYSRL